MKEVFSPCPPGMLVLFSAGEDGILTLFFSFGCYFPEEKSRVKGAMSDRLCLLFSQVFGGFEVIESLGMGDSSEMSV